jgi:hypothetical protein
VGQANGEEGVAVLRPYNSAAPLAVLLRTGQKIKRNLQFGDKSLTNWRRREGLRAHYLTKMEHLRCVTVKSIYGAMEWRVK